MSDKRLLPILLAEDSHDDVLFMKKAFAQAKILNPLLVVENGQELICYLSGQGVYQDRNTYSLPCLLLLDLDMPVTDGFGVLEWIRTQESLNGLIVVVFSNSSQQRDIRRAYDLGANSYLVKPGSLPELVDLIKLVKDYWMNVNASAQPESSPR